MNRKKARKLATMRLPDIEQVAQLRKDLAAAKEQAVTGRQVAQLLCSLLAAHGPLTLTKAHLGQAPGFDVVRHKDGAITLKSVGADMRPEDRPCDGDAARCPHLGFDKDAEVLERCRKTRARPCPLRVVEQPAPAIEGVPGRACGGDEKACPYTTGEQKDGCVREVGASRCPLSRAFVRPRAKDQGVESEVKP